ncbi:Mercuric resistance operon regulatory protein [Frondihabitans sp. 762G35]|uniref:MerR family transcriptional regulator n=1 Tax=Frondihabitans sp. 762G35 TaxID=1446794 RepID=UPI000D22086A|nr:MerR family transcriptional regulator [Frondihabitans sp. 762G35]ARC58138.1 Mercuric resistance operon regulatory protein [Frondihabitans sp. 762G35]
MRLAELARTTGVSAATIKYYLREGLLHDGALTSATQAEYDVSHATRLRLIRALVGTAGLSLAQARNVLHAVDSPPESLHDLLGRAHEVVTPPGHADVDTGEAEALLDRWGWPLDQCDPRVLGGLAAALDGARSAGFVFPETVLDAYGDAARRMAGAELSKVPLDSLEAAIRYVTLGTLLAEPVILALRRIAQQIASQERFEATRAGGSSAEPAGASPPPS